MIQADNKVNLVSGKSISLSKGVDEGDVRSPHQEYWIQSLFHILSENICFVWYLKSVFFTFCLVPKTVSSVFYQPNRQMEEAGEEQKGGEFMNNINCVSVLSQTSNNQHKYIQQFLLHHKQCKFYCFTTSSLEMETFTHIILYISL